VVISCFFTTSQSPLVFFASEFPVTRSAHSKSRPPADRVRVSSPPRRRWAVLGLLALLPVAAVVAWIIFREPPERAEALKLVRKGNLLDAEPKLQQVLERRPNDVDVLRALTEIKVATNQVKEAESLVNRWCDLRPSDTQAHAERMKVLIQGRDFPKALRDGRFVLEREPDNNDVRREVAKMLFITGDIETAESECRRYLDSDPENPEICFLRADICHSQGNYAEAAQTLDALLGRQPQNTNALLLRGVVYCDMQEPAKAIPLLRQVIELDPRGSQQMGARNQLMLALERTGQHSAAEQVRAELLWDQIKEIMSRKEHPKVGGLLLRLVETMIGIGKSAEAVEMLEKDGLLDQIAEREPACIPEAVRLLEKIIKDDPKAALAAHKLLADFYDKQGQKDKAAEHRRLGSP
jgi:tetratricopeptide (TPR) repeat protein